MTDFNLDYSKFLIMAGPNVIESEEHTLDMAFKLSRRSLDRLEGVDDRMVAVVKHAITATMHTLQWKAK